jgi:hypothetical protein
MKQSFFSILFLLSFQKTDAQLWDFKSTNLQGMGYVTGLLIHPNTSLAPNLVYARTDVGGVYRLDHGTQKWIPLLDAYVSRNSGGVLYDVESIALDPQNANIIYASLSGVAYYPNPAPGDVVKSTDRGQTWQSLNFVGTGSLLNANGEWRGTGERMAVDPNLPALLYYGTRTSGLWRKNGTAAWQKVTGGLPTSSSEPIGDYPGYTFVVFDKNTGTNGNATQTIYVGLWNSGIWKNKQRRCFLGQYWRRQTPDTRYIGQQRESIRHIRCCRRGKKIRQQYLDQYNPCRPFGRRLYGHNRSSRCAGYTFGEYVQSQTFPFNEWWHKLDRIDHEFSNR